jgi:uncharacterized Ntn-hydrolase superfamily protein
VTYSIVARDPVTGELGVAVQSHFFGVGRVVSWVRPGIGAVATQAFAEVAHGPNGLDLMAHGVAAPDAVERLLRTDPGAATRQLGLVDSAGRAAGHTGSSCVQAAGHALGEQVVVQGNMLASERAWPAMLAAYESHDGELGARLLAALEAAEATGGDIRGRQSASILVVANEPRERPWEAVRLDCRVDDHPDPVSELRRLVGLEGFYRRLLNMFSEAGVLGGELTVHRAALDRALEDLAAGRELLGTNQEATFWRGVLLARVGRLDEAREHFDAAVRVRPQLREFLTRMASLVFEHDPEAVLASVLPHKG